MPVSVDCDTSAINAAIRDTLTSNNQSDNSETLQSKLYASAKRVLLTNIEYEEVNNFNQTVLDTLKSKYIVLKPASNTKSSYAVSNDKDGNITPSSSNKNAQGQIQSKDPNQLPQPKHILFQRSSVQIGWKNTGRRWQVGAGMVNVGNTCYLNSILQAIFHVPAMANWLLSDVYHREKCENANGSQNVCTICAVAKTLISSQSSQTPIRPHLVYGKLKLVCKHLTMGRQEDAHEFLRYLVEGMEKSFLERFYNVKLLDPYSKETTPLHQILGGYLKSTVRCLSCGHMSITFQHFQDLLLDIRKANSIEEGLDSYFAKERLEDMGYNCESCKKKVSATKKFSLERAPISLCIQLKRFSMQGTKVHKHVEMSQWLDLSPYASDKLKDNLNYKLVAMVTHIGVSQNCGHYTAIGCTDSGGYYQFDDNFVRPISIQNVLNTSAYIIFYELETPNNYIKQTSTLTSRDLNERLIEYNSNKLNSIPLPSNDINRKIIHFKSNISNSSLSSSLSLDENNKLEKFNQNSASDLNKNGSNEKSFVPKINRPIHLQGDNKSRDICQTDREFYKTQKNSIIKDNLQNENTIHNNIKINGENSIDSRATLPSMPKLEDKDPLFSPFKNKSYENYKNQINGNDQNNSIKKDKTYCRSLVPYESNDDDDSLDYEEKHSRTNGILSIRKCMKKDINDKNYDSDNESILSIKSNSKDKYTTPIIKTKLGVWQVTNSNQQLNSNEFKDKTENSFINKRDSKITCSNKNDSSYHTSNGNGYSSSINNTKLDEILKPHRTYGAPVLSWNGHASKFDQEIEEERRMERKREREEDEENEMDRGHQKRIKSYNSTARNNDYNPFQKYQDRNQNDHRSWNSYYNNRYYRKSSHHRSSYNKKNYNNFHHKRFNNHRPQQQHRNNNPFRSHRKS